MNLRARVIGAAAGAVFLLVTVVLVASSSSAGDAAFSVGAFATAYGFFVLLAVVVGRDAQRHGRDGWLWGSLFVLSPVVFGIAAWGRNAEAIDLADGRRILVMVQQGFSDFVEDLAASAPGLPITLGRWAGIADRWGGASGYHRGSDG